MVSFTLVNVGVLKKSKEVFVERFNSSKPSNV